MASPLQKKLTSTEALGKIQRYCAYQERCHQEVRAKLFEYGLRSTEVDELITELVTSGFLNEERFSKAFAGGKFRMKQWGRIRITHELEARDVSKNCIRIGLKEIDESDYEKVLRTILKKKIGEVGDDDVYVVRDKVSKFAIQKGFEPDLVWRELRDMI